MSVSSAPAPDRLESVTLDVARDVMRRVPGAVPEFEPAIRYRTMERATVLFYAHEGVLPAPAPLAFWTAGGRCPSPHGCAARFPQSILG